MARLGLGVGAALGSGGMWQGEMLEGLANVAPAIAFNNAGIWTIAGTGASSTASTFGASGSVAGALAVTPPLVVGKRYYYEVTASLTAGNLQVINGTGTTVLIAETVGNGTVKGYFTATDTNFRLRTSATATATVTKLVLKKIP